MRLRAHNIHLALIHLEVIFVNAIVVSISLVWIFAIQNLIILNFSSNNLDFISANSPNQAPVCLDTDECKINNQACAYNQNCQNSIGSYTCSCKTGYQLIPLNNTCVDINECISNPCGPNQDCTNTDGSYTCLCQNYFVLKDGNCAFQERTTNSIQFQLSFNNFNCSLDKSLFLSNLTNVVSIV